MDEFDAVVKDLAPFWALSGEELRRRTYLVGSTSSTLVGSALMLLTDGTLAFHRPRAHPGR